MKSSVLLRNIISITYYCMILFWIILLGIFIYSIFGDEESAIQLFKNSEYLKITSKAALITTLGYSLISFAFWIYLFRMIRNLMDSLTSKSIFTNFQISSFKIIGQLLIFLSILDTIFSFIFDFISKNHFRIKFDFLEFWLIIALGLFFIFISQIFHKAKALREENELTV
ncbi:DUF2975 domain-containing protein [Christiangramia aquimixticola]|uniref:DUF2975 domain-containing protein n=1 Tax=Christiangramia aquimixticola TaxID=1697558 RepID=UPI003AA9E1E3